MAGSGGVAGKHGDYRAALAAGSTVPAKADISYGKMHGMPAVFISDEDMIRLAKPFELTLVGKFSVDRPSIADIRKFIVKMKFFAFVRVDKHDSRHVVFRFADERDYMRFFARRLYNVFGIAMRVTKWSPFTDVTEELPIFPLWVSFPGLRYQLFHLETLMDIAALFGKTLCVDSNTASQGVMSQARVLVEVDISVEHPKTIWIGSQGKGVPQEVIIENLPSFCKCCKKMGHLLGDCKVRNQSIVDGGVSSSIPLLQWVPKPPGLAKGSEGTSTGEAAPPNMSGCNHPRPVQDANFSNYEVLKLDCLIEEARRKSKGKEPNGELNLGAIELSIANALPVSTGCNLGDSPPIIPLIPSDSAMVPEVSMGAPEEEAGEGRDMGFGEPEASAMDPMEPDNMVVPVLEGIGVAGGQTAADSSGPDGLIAGLDLSLPVSPPLGTPYAPSISIMNSGRGKQMSFSNVVKLGAKSSSPPPPLSPRKTRLQAKSEAQGGTGWMELIKEEFW